MLKPSIPNGYRNLVSKISSELDDLDAFIRRRTAEGYWRIGKYIHDHLLAHKGRADYGESIYPLLAKDVGRDASTLQRIVQFYRAYPIVAPARKLTWGHYRSLITIKDKDTRRKLEKEIIRKNWNTKDLRAYLSHKRELTAAEDDDKPISQLKFTRGRLHTYQIVKANPALVEKIPLVLDLGFRLQQALPSDVPRLKEEDIVELVFKGGRISEVQKVVVAKDELFTYQAHVDKIIDGDTLLTSFDFNLETSISQKLRLRGIDCPEMDTEEGKKAKRFVEARVKGGDLIIVKTYKDRSDKFDRYLADVFYLPLNNIREDKRNAPRDPKGRVGVTTEWDPAFVASEGKYLNQELLDERLAVKY